MAKVTEVCLAGFSMDSYELDGPIDNLIKTLTELRDQGVRAGLVGIHVSTDYVDEPVYEYGGYQGKTEKVWTVKIIGERRSLTKFKTKLPKAQYNDAFQQGLEAAQNGVERDITYRVGTRWGEAWLDGFDSHKDVHTEHCCSVHGCKYGDDDCSVAVGKKIQSFPCEACDYEDGRDAYLEGIMKKD